MIYSDQINSIQSLGKKELYESPIQPEFIVKKIALTMLSFSLLLSMGISVNLEEATHKIDQSQMICRQLKKTLVKACLD